MEGKTLEEVIKSCNALKNHFKGVFSINTMPSKLKKREFYFSNTDLKNEPGTHWFCIVCNDNNDLEFFDSLGVDEIKIKNFLKYSKIKNKKSLFFNETAVQDTASDTCGYFVLYFAIKRLFNIDTSFRNVMNDSFDVDKQKNENEVIEFLRNFDNSIKF